MENRQEKVLVETDRYRVEGMLTLPQEGYHSRVSDHVNRRDQEFFTILDAQLVAIDGSGRDWDTPVLMLARRHIRLIVPASDGAEMRAAGRLSLVAGRAVLGAALWWRKHPSACPYSQRFWVDAPHPFITRERLKEIL